MLPISLTMAGIAALINIWLGMRCGQVRQAEKISIGDGGSEKLIARMRAQANFIENVPLLLILVVLIEMALGGGDGSSHGPVWLWVLAGAIMIGRVLHALGMDGTLPVGRTIGTLLTMLSLAGLALYAIVLPHLPYNAPAQTETVETVQ
jgi:uncharacterized membrane protein YecN with MAPEG domain